MKLLFLLYDMVFQVKRGKAIGDIYSLRVE